MTVNGKAVDYEPLTLLEYLRRNGYRVEYVVVERACEIITRERFGEIILQESDNLNILQFMGGG